MENLNTSNRMGSDEVAEMLLIQNGYNTLEAMQDGISGHANGTAHLLKSYCEALMPEQIRDIAIQLFPELAKHPEFLDEGIDTLKVLIKRLVSGESNDDSQLAEEEMIAQCALSLYNGAMESKLHELAFSILIDFEYPYFSDYLLPEIDIDRLSLELCHEAIDAGKLDLANDIESTFAGRYWENKDIGLTLRTIQSRALATGNIDLAKQITTEKAGLLLDDMLED